MTDDPLALPCFVHTFVSLTLPYIQRQK